MNEKMIEKYMKNLGLSREEAIQLIADDENDVSVELTPEQKKNVKEVTRGDRKKETTPRKRERKIDEDKRFLIDVFAWALTTDCENEGDNVYADNVTITNAERQIDFDYNDNHYQLTLIKNRKPKE